MRTVAAGRRNGQDNRDDGSVRAGFAEVHLDEKDASKAIERRRDEELPPVEDDDGGDSAISTREREWVDRSKAVAKRIGRINRQFNQIRAEDQAERQREREDFQRQIDSLKADRAAPVAVDEARHNSEMADLERQLEAAHEKGESAQVARLTREMSRKDAEFMAAKQRQLMGTQTREREQPRAQTQQRTDLPQPGQITPGKRWMDSQDWWDDGEHVAEQGAAIAIDKDLLQSRSDPSSPEHYKELNRRLKKKFPKLEIGNPFKPKRQEEDEDEEDDADEGDDSQLDDDGDEVKPVKVAKAKKRPPVPAFNSNNQGQQPTSRRGSRAVVLTQQDKVEMRKFKLDPDDDNDVMEWARSRMETDQQYGGSR